MANVTHVHAPYTLTRSTHSWPDAAVDARSRLTVTATAHLRTALPRLGLIGTGLLVGLVLLELFVRIFLGYRGIASPTAVYRYDEVLGWRLKANASDVSAGFGFRVHYRTNSRGLRDQEIPYERSGRALRVLVLGDSFTEGFGVELEESYVKQLQHLLEARTGRTVEVINGGVSGYGTDQELLFYTREGVRYAPDVTIVAFIGGDEYDGQVRSPDNFGRSITYYKPYFRVEGESLVLHGVPVPRIDLDVRGEDPLDPLKRHLRSTGVYAMSTHLVYRSPWIRELLIRAGLAKPVTASGVTKQLYADTWHIYRRILAELQSAITSNGGHMLFAVLDESDTTYRPEGHTYAALTQGICLELGIPFIDVAGDARLTALERSGALRLRGDNHWTRLGHKAAAEVLAERLLAFPPS